MTAGLSRDRLPGLPVLLVLLALVAVVLSACAAPFGSPSAPAPTAEATANPSAAPTDLPGAPTLVSATPSNGQVALVWAAPASEGSSPIIDYIATASPDGATCTSAELGCTIGGLANGTSYSFSVKARNTDGPGPASNSLSSIPLPPEAIPLEPAKPGANPVDLLAWLFTPVWQALFITLVGIDQVLANIAISIIILTLLLRLILVPVYRRQLVSQRRMQMLAPEIAEIRKRYKGDRLKQNEAVQRFYQERGVNPASGCLPLLLQFVLLIPMYSVISAGLTNTDPSAMLNVFGVQVIDLNCPPLEFYPDGKVVPCINTVAFGVNWTYPQISFMVLSFGISGLAIITALIQFVQSRMMLPPSDPSSDDANTRVQRQTMLILPLISVIYGAFLPAGLLLYWLVSTVFTVIQQYLIIGWGSTFPIFGWTPAFARDHTPRFPVSIPAPRPAKDGTGAPATPTPADRSAAAASTIRRRERGRQGRRGRRR